MTESRTKSPPPLQLLIAFDALQLRGMSLAERRQAVTCLARLLLEAKVLGVEGRYDER